MELVRRHAFTLGFLSLFIIFVFFYTDDEATLQRFTGYTMGTSYEVQLVEFPAGVEPDVLAAEIRALLSELDTGIFSTYAPDSELSRFNRLPVDTAFIASDSLLEVLQMAQDIARLTDGAFDVTVGPLVNLWGFGPTIGIPDEVPTPEAIADARTRIGYEALLIDAAQHEIRKQRDIYVDLSGIAKGYAVDRLAALLDDAGVDSYFLEIGGELKIRGLKPGGRSWVPAIEAPVDGVSQIYEIFYNRGETLGVAGSGDYRNYFEADGIRYSHEIDPRTGRPISHNLAAVYVIDAATARADALATAFMVLGLEAGQALAERERLAVYFIYKANSDNFADFVTPEFANYLEQGE